MSWWIFENLAPVFFDLMPETDEYRYAENYIKLLIKINTTQYHCQIFSKEIAMRLFKISCDGLKKYGILIARNMRINSFGNVICQEMSQKY